jgi:hypothetical protein
MLLTAWVLTACGGKTTPPVSSSQHELDQRHCVSHSECASGLCQNGRCG